MDSNQKPKVKENLTKAKKTKEERDAAAIADQLEGYVAKTGICFDPNRGRYYLRDSRGVWVGYSDRHVNDVLARYGVPLMAPSDRKDVAVAAHLTDYSRFHRVVDLAMPLCGKKSGFMTFAGRSVLVTTEAHLIEPKAGEWTLTRAFIGGLLGSRSEPHAHTQMHTFYAWMQRAVLSLRSGEATQAQALVLAGEHNSGKTTLTKLIVKALGGRHAAPLAYMSGESAFNSDLFGAETLVVDDEALSNRSADRERLAHQLKQMCVTGSARYHSKGVDATMLPTWWRVVFALNDNAKSLQVLPPLVEGVRDKIIILKGSTRTESKFPAGTSEAEIDAAYEAELPAFLHWLLHEFKVPPEMRNERFGIETWHHPEPAEILLSLDDEAQLLSLIDEADKSLFTAGDVWVGTPTQAHRRLADDSKTASALLRLVKVPSRIGEILKRLCVSNPDRVSFNRTNKDRLYTIRRQMADGTIASLPEEESALTCA